MSEKAKHPPIPPNCPRFANNDGVDQFASFVRCDGTVEDWDDIDWLIDSKTEGRNCRNEARCAWLDEIVRLKNLELRAEPGAILRAHANAEAWRVWGNGI